MLLCLSGWLVIAHGVETWKLRDRQLMSSVEEATSVDRTQWRFLAYGARIGEALYLLRIPFLDISPGGSDSAEFHRRLGEELELHPVPTIVIADRFVMDGMPHTARSEWSWSVDTAPLEGWELLRRRGRAYAGRWVPKGTPIPETRK
jgi:hypothetical protein